MDGEDSALSANLIAENTLAQIDEEVNCHVLMDKITDHRFYEATVKSQDNFVTTYSGTKIRRKMTQGLSLCIKGGTVTQHGGDRGTSKILTLFS